MVSCTTSCECSRSLRTLWTVDLLKLQVLAISLTLWISSLKQMSISLAWAIEPVAFFAFREVAFRLSVTISGGLLPRFRHLEMFSIYELVFLLIPDYYNIVRQENRTVQNTFLNQLTITQKTNHS